MRGGRRFSQGWTRRPRRLTLAALALGLAGTAFLLQARNEINLYDEGYLWYGAIATLKGQVPGRDFVSYDPARYYWAAAWFWLLGDHGIVPLRIACAALHALGIFCGLLVLSRVARRWDALALGGTILTLWMYPPFMPNHTLAMGAVYGAVLLIERPTLGRHLLAGILAGLAAFVARNVGGYVCIAYAGLLLVLGWGEPRRVLCRRAAAWTLGVVIGLAPLLYMLVFVPGFWAANVELMALHAEMGRTNIGKAIPWPWRQSTLWGVCVGTFFVLAPLVYGLAVGWALVGGRERWLERPVLVAATLTGVPFLHYAYSRPDVEHLAMSIHPLLIGLLSLLFGVSRRRRYAAAAGVVLLAVLSGVAVGGAHPLYRQLTAPPDSYRRVEIGRWSVWMPWVQAELIEGAIRFNREVLHPDEGFLVLPYRGGAFYAILERDSPVWQTYFVLPFPERHQRRMIEEMERHRVNWILFEDEALDGDEELRFRNANRLMWEHIQRHFELVPEGLPMNFHLFKRKGAGAADGSRPDSR